MSVQKHFFSCDEGHKCKHCPFIFKPRSGAGDEEKPKFYNLKRHLLRQHNAIYAEMLKEEEEAERKRQRLVAQPQQKKITAHFDTAAATTSRITIQMSKKELQSHIVNMICKNGVALDSIARDGIFGIIGEMAKKLGVSLSRDVVRELV